MQYTNEFPIEQMEMKVYFKHGIAQSELYQDAGDGYGYQVDDYTLHEFEMVGSATEIVINQTRSGKRHPDYETFKIELIGLPFKAKVCEVDGNQVPIKNGRIVVNVNFKNLTIR